MKDVRGDSEIDGSNPLKKSSGSVGRFRLVLQQWEWEGLSPACIVLNKNHPFRTLKKALYYFLVFVLFGILILVATERKQVSRFEERAESERQEGTVNVKGLSRLTASI